MNAIPRLSGETIATYNSRINSKNDLRWSGINKYGAKVRQPPAKMRIPYRISEKTRQSAVGRRFINIGWHYMTTDVEKGNAIIEKYILQQNKKPAGKAYEGWKNVYVGNANNKIFWDVATGPEYKYRVRAYNIYSCPDPINSPCPMAPVVWSSVLTVKTGTFPTWPDSTYSIWTENPTKPGNSDLDYKLVDIRWNEPQTNGAAVSKYEIQIYAKND